MKLTAKKLKEIIREEMKKISEASWVPPHAKDAEYGDSPTSLAQSFKQRSGRPDPLAAPAMMGDWDNLDSQGLLNGKQRKALAPLLDRITGISMAEFDDNFIMVNYDVGGTDEELYLKVGGPGPKAGDYEPYRESKRRK